MVQITLPDGKAVTAGANQTFADVLSTHMPNKEARTFLAVQVDGVSYDLTATVVGGHLQGITWDSEQGKLLHWHSSAHALAQAVKRLYPDARFDDGPALLTGPGHFFYDIHTSTKITEDDFPAIEEELHKIVRENHIVTRRNLSKADALEKYRAEGEIFKIDIIERFPDDAIIGLYRQGEFEDMCRGPHIPSTGRLGFFKLTAISGAYWKGNSENPMLTRIYGVSFPDKAMLKEWERRIEEARKRDHRKLGRELGLFHMQPEAPGMVFWHPQGWTLYQNLESYVRRKITAAGYQEVRTPSIADSTLWNQSGHSEKYADNMFFTESENRTFAIKPMNCPCHVEIFKTGLKSYRDLPLRMAEFGSCHRNEPSGTLHGLMRVRGFTQDDAHIFCTEDQLQQEISAFIMLLREVYAELGFDSIRIKLSTRPEKRVGSEEIWDRAEAALQVALDTMGLEWELNPGEGAFYGPKIEFSLKDSLDRVWQCGTIQVDYTVPERLGAEYVAPDGSRKTPVMLHRAILGSMERFIGILIEHLEGKMPVWLSPRPVTVLSVSEEHAAHVTDLVSSLRSHGIAAAADIRNEKIGYKIREWIKLKGNYALIIGSQETTTGSVSVRTRGSEATETMPFPEFLAKIRQEVAGP